MKKILICEGYSDATILRTIFAAIDMIEVKIMEGGGKSSAISLGTSFALNGGARVAIVVDADTTDPDLLKEQQSIFNDLVSRIPYSGSCRLFLAVPTLEEAIFPTAKDFAFTFGLKITPSQEARYAENWNSLVSKFLTKSEDQSLAMIKTAEISQAKIRKLFEKPPLRELKAFIEGK